MTQPIDYDRYYRDREVNWDGLKDAFINWNLAITNFGVSSATLSEVFNKFTNTYREGESA